MLKKSKANSNRNTPSLALRRQALGLFSVAQNLSGAEASSARLGNEFQSFREVLIANKKAHLLIISNSASLDVVQICYRVVLDEAFNPAPGKAEQLEILSLDRPCFGAFVKTKINKIEKGIKKRLTEADYSDQFEALVSWTGLKLETLTYPDISRDITKVAGDAQRKLVVCIDLLDQLVKHLQAMDERAILGLYDLLEHPAITIVGGTSPQDYTELKELEPQILAYFQCFHL